jgi:hypothetical protein
VEINCGAGAADVANRDLASIDPDSILSGCETVNPAVAPPGGPANPNPANPNPVDPGPAGPGTITPDPTLPVSPALSTLGSMSAITPKASGKGARITINLGSTAACPAGATAGCSLTATVTAAIPRRKGKAKKATLGKLARTLRPGQAAKVVVKLSTAGSKAWRTAGRLKIAFTTRLAVPGGTSAARSRSVKLTPPQRSGRRNRA